MPGADSGEVMRALTNRAKCESKDWISVVIHYSDTGLILRQILDLNEMSEFPISPGLIIGIDLTCRKGSISGEILFTKYPGKINK
jgi:hypothetical protein